MNKQVFKRLKSLDNSKAVIKLFYMLVNELDKVSPKPGYFTSEEVLDFLHAKFYKG